MVSSLFQAMDRPAKSHGIMPATDTQIYHTRLQL